MERTVDAVDVADVSNLCLSQINPTASPSGRNLGLKSQLDLTVLSGTLHNSVTVSGGFYSAALPLADISFSISTPLSRTYSFKKLKFNFHDYLVYKILLSFLDSYSLWNQE